MSLPVTDLAQLRVDYKRAAFRERDAAANPFDQFTRWFDEALAAGVPEPNAMTLATVDAAGRPSARIVLLKSLDARGFVFHTNYDSRKGRELAVNARAALLFFWPELERQIRIEGTARAVSASESDGYFAVRPRASRIGAWASPQSQVVESRAVLVANAAKFGARYLLNPPRPPHWGGFRLTPDNWEFWQGRRSRLHDRLRYRLESGRWLRERLAP